MVTIEEYRKLLKDYKSPEEVIIKRINYIESLCRNIIRSEIKSYVSRTKSKEE